MSCDAALRVSSSIPRCESQISIQPEDFWKSSKATLSGDFLGEKIKILRHREFPQVADTPSRSSRRHGSAQAGHRTPRVSPGADPRCVRVAAGVPGAAREGRAGADQSKLATHGRICVEPWRVREHLI
jgi:hypothetical protein